MLENSTTLFDEIQPEYKPCPNVMGAFAGYREVNAVGQVVTGCLPCDRWDCPVCGPRKKRSLWIRYQKGTISENPSSIYGRKFLTLTCPGVAFRAIFNPEESYCIMADAFAHMIRNLRHRYGHFDFMRVAEAQRDGWPHFHVLLVGDNIAPKGILDDIEHYWRKVYRMGFVKLNKVSFKDGGHALNYILKYITKDVRGFGRYKRIFSASRDALARVEKIKWLSMRVEMGRANDTGIHSIDISAEEIFDMAANFQPDGMYKTYESAMDQVLNVFLGSNVFSCGGAS